MNVSNVAKTIPDKKCVKTYQHNLQSNSDMWMIIIDNDEILVFQETKNIIKKVSENFQNFDKRQT
jgi:hypothetical protein